MSGKLFPVDNSFQAGDQAFQNQCGFTRTGHACYDRQPALRYIDFQWFYCMNLTGGQMDVPQRKQFLR